MSRKKVAIGIDLGATNLRIVLGNRKGDFLEKKVRKTKRDGKTGEVITHQIIHLVNSIIDQSGIKRTRITGIGIGSIGPLNMHQGVIKASPNIPYKRIPLTNPLEEHFSLPVFLLNDCMVAVIGEKYFGAGKGKENLAFITLSSGIGGGVFVNDHLLIGKNGNASEIGHLVIDLEGPQCGCGKKGHWEAFAGGENIPTYVAQLIKENVISPDQLLEEEYTLKDLSSKLIYNLAKAGNKEAEKIVEEIGKINAIGFADVINCFAPSLITLGGAIALNNPKLVLEPIRKNVGNFTINKIPPIKLTPLGEEIVLYGALWMAIHQFSPFQKKKSTTEIRS